jgi:hypothetical protein
MTNVSGFLEFIAKYGVSHVIGKGAGGVAQFLFEGAMWAAEKLNASEAELRKKYWTINWEMNTSPKNHLAGCTYGTWYFKTKDEAWAAYEEASRGDMRVSTPQAPGT